MERSIANITKPFLLLEDSDAGSVTGMSNF